MPLHVLELKHGNIMHVLFVASITYVTTPLCCIYHLFVCPKLPLPIQHGAIDRVWANKLQDSPGGTSCSKHPRVFGSGDFWCLHLSIHNAERVSLVTVGAREWNNGRSSRALFKNAALGRTLAGNSRYKIWDDMSIAVVPSPNHKCLAYALDSFDIFHIILLRWTLIAGKHEITGRMGRSS